MNAASPSGAATNALVAKPGVSIRTEHELLPLERRFGVVDPVSDVGPVRSGPVTGLLLFCDGPGRSRTCDLGIKSPLLYQLSYRPAAREYRGVLPGSSNS